MGKKPSKRFLCVTRLEFQKPNTTTENISCPRKSVLRKYHLLVYNQTIMQIQITRITTENYQCELLGKRGDMY